MRKPMLWIFVLLIGASVAIPFQTFADEPNPGMAAMGKSSYRVYCASCHGVAARGNGSVAEYLTIPPSDLTQIAARNDGEYPAERVFKIIDGREKVRGHGGGEMPVWGDVFKMSRDTPDDEAVKQRIEELVHFLQSIQEEAAD